jgi:hypothetical protein
MFNFQKTKNGALPANASEIEVVAVAFAVDVL